MIFSSEFFCHADFFIHRITRNLVGGFLLRRLLTDWRGSDLFGRCRYPLGLEYVPLISQIYTDFFHLDFSSEFFVTQISQMTQIFYLIKICVNLWNLWDKKTPRRKICVICEICVTKKQLQHISGASQRPEAKYPRKSVSNPISKMTSDSSVKSDEEKVPQISRIYTDLFESKKINLC